MRGLGAVGGENRGDRQHAGQLRHCRFTGGPERFGGRALHGRHFQGEDDMAVPERETGDHILLHHRAARVGVDHLVECMENVVTGSGSCHRRSIGRPTSKTNRFQNPPAAEQIILSAV